MTEKEKMVSGALYFSGGEELSADRLTAKSLCFEYNNLHPSQTTRREEVIKQLFGRIGKSFVIEQTFLCDYGYNIEAGDNFYVNHNCVILDCAKVTFGDNVMIGPNCGFYSAGHPIYAKQRISGAEFAQPITIGSEVWIGGGVSIMPGVTIGEGSVIGGGSVVTKDIPAGVVAVGNPCRVIRKITSDDIINREKNG